jgi:hypothetical protein
VAQPPSLVGSPAFLTHSARVHQDLPAPVAHGCKAPLPRGIQIGTTHQARRKVQAARRLGTPVMLDDEAIDKWLYVRQSPQSLMAQLRSAHDGLLIEIPVSSRVNSVKNDDPECVAPAVTEAQQD